jgi:hypothetical protein
MKNRLVFYHSIDRNSNNPFTNPDTIQIMKDFFKYQNKQILFAQFIATYILINFLINLIN